MLQTNKILSKYQNILKEDFPSYIAKCFFTINPNANFLPNWHILLISEVLNEVLKGNIKRLIINMPPRYLKSICVSVAWPSWLLGLNSSNKIIVTSYSQLLSNKHSMDCKLVMQSEWYKELFPNTSIKQNQNTKSKFYTKQYGFRFATSVQGTLTGEGGDFLIIDDPHNSIHVNSKVKRKQVIDWFDQSFISRLNDKNKGVIVVVMQRLHDDDLTGHLMRKKDSNWYCLKIPAISQSTTHIAIGNFIKTRLVNEVLHPERENNEQINVIRKDLGEYGFSSQYQQDPLPIKGNMIKVEWLKKYLTKENYNQIIQSWDTAIKTGINNDYSVCTTWGITKNSYYLLDVVRVRVEYPNLKTLIIKTADIYAPNAILIEDKASGQSLLQDLKQETNLPFIAIKAILDKVTRFAACSPFFEAEKIFLPASEKWLVDYEKELLTFPFSSHDDQVDSTSQFLAYIKSTQNKKNVLPNLRSL